MSNILAQKTVNIGLDFDGTITADPQLWIDFVIKALRRKHRVYIVTMRCPTEPHVLLKEFETYGGVKIIYTSRQAKRPVCEALGINIDIWIDDNPRAVNEDAQQIWTTYVPEGQADNPAAYVDDSNN